MKTILYAVVDDNNIPTKKKRNSKLFLFSSPFNVKIQSVIKFLFLTKSYQISCVAKFVCFVALRPKSTAMVMAGRSVHLAALFPGQA